MLFIDNLLALRQYYIKILPEADCSIGWMDSSTDERDAMYLMPRLRDLAFSTDVR